MAQADSHHKLSTLKELTAALDRGDVAGALKALGLDGAAIAALELVEA